MHLLVNFNQLYQQTLETVCVGNHFTKVSITQYYQSNDLYLEVKHSCNVLNITFYIIFEDVNLSANNNVTYLKLFDYSITSMAQFDLLRLMLDIQISLFIVSDSKTLLNPNNYGYTSI